MKLTKVKANTHDGQRCHMNIPRYLQEKVDCELEPGERIQWMDMPVPRFFTAASTPVFIFGIVWTAFTSVWMTAAVLGSSMSKQRTIFTFFLLFGLVFFVVGLLMLSSPIFARRKAMNTLYVITDRRAITFEGGRTITVRSFLPDQLRNVYRREKRDGTGDVIFVEHIVEGSRGSSRREELGFMRVRDPKMVEEMLRRLSETVKTRQGVSS